MKVFIIGFSSDKGGIEAYINNLCLQFDYNYIIIHHLPQMEIDGKKWIMPQNRHNPFKYRNFWKRFYKENHFDAVYFNTCDIVSIDQLKFAKQAGVPIRIIHAHSINKQFERKGLWGWFHRLSEKHSRKNLHKFATHLLACSKSAGDWMFDGRDYTIIKNGIDLKKYQYSQEKRLCIQNIVPNSATKVIASIGRLDHEKNPFFTLEIFKQLCSLNSDVQCIFIGDGEFRSELEKKVKDAGLQERIFFTGAVDNVNEWLSYIDALVMPSLFEGLPFALVEAQAAGIHSLVSDTVSEESNITGLVEYKSLSDSPESWAQRLFELAEKPREDVSEKLEKDGFSIAHSAQIVKTILNGH